MHEYYDSERGFFFFYFFFVLPVLSSKAYKTQKTSFQMQFCCWFHWLGVCLCYWMLLCNCRKKIPFEAVSSFSKIIKLRFRFNFETSPFLKAEEDLCLYLYDFSLQQSYRDNITVKHFYADHPRWRAALWVEWSTQRCFS